MAPVVKTRIKCKHCTHTFGRQCHYEEHIARKHNLDPFVISPKCPLCDEFFVYKSNATVHLKRSHKKEMKKIPPEDIKNYLIFEKRVNPGSLVLFD